MVMKFRDLFFLWNFVQNHLDYAKEDKHKGTCYKNVKRYAKCFSSHNGKANSCITHNSCQVFPKIIIKEFHYLLLECLTAHVPTTTAIIGVERSIVAAMITKILIYVKNLHLRLYSFFSKSNQINLINL